MLAFSVEFPDDVEPASRLEDSVDTVSTLSSRAPVTRCLASLESLELPVTSLES